MPENNNTTGKHLTFEQRQTIEEHAGRKPLRFMAQILGVHPSTVSRELKRNRVRDKSYRYGHGTPRFCANERQCSIHRLCNSGCMARLCRACRHTLCTNICTHYTEAHCSHLDAVYVCNGCSKKASCNVKRWIYDARQADALARLRLSEERSGFDLESCDLKEVAKLIVPLIKRGQSIGQIYLSHAEQIPFSERSLRTYIHAGVFSELSDFDLNRKVRYRVRKKRAGTRLARKIPDHSYSDFALLPSNKQMQATELDTVIGRRGGKCLLTLFMRSCSLMLLFLLDSCDSDCVYEAISLLADCVFYSKDNLDFWKLFPIWLPDRGSEFADFKSLESFGIDDERNQITCLYYCDPRSPEQRGGQEKNHEYIREIVPKKTSFDALTQNDVCLMASHINSIPRESLGGKTPYELASFLYGKDWLDNLGIVQVKRDDVIRKPWLLDKNRQNQ